MRVELTVNGEARTVAVEPRTSLLDCLRDELLLTGAHAGCEHGVCGACTVLVDGAPVRSCLMFAVQADGYAITTIEGLAPGPGELSPIQDAFCETHGMQCGYCTVLVDGAPVRSCLMFAVQADGYAITTIEGLAPGPGELSPIQDAFCETHGMQCGYCTPAMILTAHALLADNPAPTRADIVDAISANICRCTGYAQIVEAIALAAERMRSLNRPASSP